MTAADPFSGRHPRTGTLVTFQEPIPYQESWKLQQQLHAARVSGTTADTLLLLEHLPVYTAGRRTDPAHLGAGEASLRQTGATVQAVNRGGSITYHGPGQLVGYPIFALAQYASGPKEYVRLLEDALIATLALWGIEGHRVHKAPGVWVHSERGDAKIASIGVRIDQGVTLHGFALNVDLDLTPFSLIVPCGLAGCRVTSLAELHRSSIPVGVVAAQVADIFSTLFDIEWTGPPADRMRPHLLDRRLMDPALKEA
ncbi:MAG TPA: lipoyl(octanoyl) transferase LipB [Nitrospira sp.]|nr:lipoyl(octanoyl) transferase LipB [Nitrospira sp.]